MNEAERAALSSLKFNYAPTPDDVWKPSPFHVEALHKQAVDTIFEGVGDARSSNDSSPLGVVIQGASGAGKTHMLGMVRQRIQRDAGYFFLVSLLSGTAFWESTALCMVEGLLRDAGSWPTQLKGFLRRLTATVGLPAETRDVIAGDARLTPADLDTFIVALRGFNRAVGQETQDTARALVLYGSQDLTAQDVGYAYLMSTAPDDSADRSQWGISSRVRTPELIVRDLSRLLALTGPTVIALDQIDTLISQSMRSVITSSEPAEQHDALLVGQVAHGVMSLREMTRRTLAVVACLPDTWVLMKKHAATPVPDRFSEASFLDRIPNAAIGEEIVAKRFHARFTEIRFVPPYPTWPINRAAFADANQYTPRALLKRVEQHITMCLRTDAISELLRLDDGNALSELISVEVSQTMAPSDALADLDARFAELVSHAEVDDALNHKTEDQVVPLLLTAAVQAWIEEQGTTAHGYKHDPPPSAKPALHARLRQTLDERTEDEMHWGFRAIASTSAVAVISRIRAACTMAGLDRDVDKRKLVLLRNTSWSLGPKTKEVVAAFRDAGGQTCDIRVDDLKTFAALQQMLADRSPDLHAWLLSRKPASGSVLLKSILDGEPVQADDSAASDSASGLADILDDVDTAEVEAAEGEPAVNADAPPRTDATSDAHRPAAQAGETHPEIRLGTALDTEQPFVIGIESLRKHTAIFAGSGSGKTVLIRRLIEECALQGISTIVLDPNNDLSRLGDAWPEPPAGWGPADAAKAQDYLDNTDVVVWTPRRETGRPLVFQPLPDFAAVQDDPDEFGAAIDAAVAALAPRARVDGPTVKSQLGQAVLREALRFYARQGSPGLRSFIGVLSALPDGVSALVKGEKIAAEMADTLTAAMVNDPLFGGAGSPVDPGVLLTPPPGKRARVSVISFVGLTSEQQRQGFVNQLQMALFAWIKRHPAGDRPLGGLFVMDEAQTLAPSGAMTACTSSTIALVSQARKYGLGLVFATQAPRGLHNQIPGNSATQFFGLLNSPAQIAAAREMAQAKGGSVPDIGLLTTGQFYAAREGFAFQKIQAPLCLTYHPKSPLTPEEVLQRAARA